MGLFASLSTLTLPSRVAKEISPAAAGSASSRDTGLRNAPKTSASSEFLAGSIHDHLDAWEALEPSDMVLDTIRFGYTIPFVTAPEQPTHLGNRASALANSEFVNSEILDLLKTGAVARVPSRLVQSTHVHPLSGFRSALRQVENYVLYWICLF